MNHTQTITPHGGFNTGDSIADFIEEWGQTHEDKCCDLDLEEKWADEVLMLDFFFYQEGQVWIPKENSFYTKEEQDIANKLRNK